MPELENEEQSRAATLNQLRGEKKITTKTQTPTKTTGATSGIPPLDKNEFLLWLVTLIPVVGPAIKFLVRLKRMNVVQALLILISLIPLVGPGVVLLLQLTSNNKNKEENLSYVS